METNLKMRREKYFPGIHKFEKLLRWLWSQFRSSCSDLEWKKPTTVNSQHVQEGYESFHMAVSDLKDTFHGLYIFCTRSQGVPALVSVSDGKIQITILILRRRPYLVFLTHQFYICIFVTTILLQFCTEPTVFWNCKKGLLLMAFSSKLSTSKLRDSPQCYQYFKARYWYFEARYRYFEDGYRYFEAIYRYFEARYQ